MLLVGFGAALRRSELGRVLNWVRAIESKLQQSVANRLDSGNGRFRHGGFFDS
jgi:hypothetical protein